MADPDPYRTPTTQATVYERQSSTLAETLFSFRGRIPRRTYWLWSLLSALVFFGIAAIAEAIAGSSESLAWLQIVALLLYIPYIWITFAIQTKRWHDHNKSGWWFLISVIPLIGGIWVFVELGCLRGTHGPNAYGEDPT